jgi:hypothetical protein
MQTYLVVRRSAWATEQAQQAADQRSNAQAARMLNDIESIRSYVLEECDRTLGSVCVFVASSPEAGRLDATLDPVNPEALLYERRNDGTLKLTGVEYIVAQHTATGAPVPRPSLYGQQFADTNLARFGDPSTNVWTLHAWVFKPNPGGMFDPWNTRVSC